jgi:peptidoglycan hydrolase-like protein with peptidoglycan-binding domain
VSNVLLRLARCAGAAALVGIAGMGGTALAASGHPGSGGATLSASASQSGKHLGDRVLWPGMSGHDVRVLQQYLTFAGYSTTITGDFDMPTRAHVVAFERAHHLTATGIVTVKVEKTLRKSIAVYLSRPSGSVRINPDGTGTPPAGAPSAVVTMVNAANRIIHTSYCYAGGHGSWNSSCYDCSGAVGYVLHAAGMLSSPEPSGSMESWGSAGPGRWVSVYADAGHAFIVIAGRAFDTANFGGPNIPDGSGPRWRSNPTGNLQDGGSYVVRHPAGL